MRTLIIVNSTQTGDAFKRYLKYLYLSDSLIINFSKLRENGTSPFLNYDLIISDIYDNTNVKMINYGLQFGAIFEQKNIRMIYFFTSNSFKNSNNINNLPGNCFYIPFQLTDFLRSINDNLLSKNSSTRLMLILNSQPLTSSHH